MGLMLGLAGALALPVQGQTPGTATVIFPPRTGAGAASTRAITVTPRYGPLAQGPSVIWSAPMVYYPTNTVVGWGTNVAVMYLVPNTYSVSMQGLPGTMTLSVGTNNVGTTNYAYLFSSDLLSLGPVNLYGGLMSFMGRTNTQAAVTAADIAAAGGSTNISVVNSRTSTGGKMPAMGVNLYAIPSATTATFLSYITNGVQSGMVRNGWVYWDWDFGWCTNRDVNGRMQPVPGIPDMGALVAAAHSLGAKVGLYIHPNEDGKADYNAAGGMPMPNTCFSNIVVDADSFAKWRIDYLKLDHGMDTDAHMMAWMTQFAAALDAACQSNRTERIYLSVTAGNLAEGYTVGHSWMPLLCDSTRLCADGNWNLAHYDSWSNVWVPTIDAKWITGPGHYTYMNGNMSLGWTGGTAWFTTNDTRANYGMCAVANQELCSSMPPSDPTDMAMIFNNPEFTAIMRDALCASPTMVSSNWPAQVWQRPLANGDWLVAFWNQNSNATASISLSLTNLPGLTVSTAIVRDIFTRSSMQVTNTLTATVNTNGCNLYRVAGQSYTTLPGATVNYTDGEGKTWVFVNGQLTTPPMMPGYDPTNIAGLAFYLNYRDLPYAGNKVSAWADRVQGTVFSQSDPNLRPTADGDNGLLFANNGASYGKLGCAVNPPNIGANFSMWFVFKQRNLSAGDYYAGLLGTASPSAGFYIHYATGSSPGVFDYFQSGDHGYAFAVIPTNTWCNVLWANGTVYTNGILAGTGYNSPGQIYDVIGTINGNTFDGWIKCIAIWTNVLTANDAANLNRFELPTAVSAPLAYDTRTNSWAVNTAFPLGTNAYYTSGAATFGFPGVANVPAVGERVGQLVIKATGDITLTNIPSIYFSDGGTNRTITNGNTARIWMSITSGTISNALLTQFWHK
jgi:alpha-galactosidase